MHIAEGWLQGLCELCGTPSVDSKIGEVLAKRRCPIIDNLYITIAKLFSFGALQASLFPHARYPFKEDGADAPRQLLSFEDYVRKNPNRKVFSKGVLDILASSMGRRWIEPEDGTYGGFRLFCAPKILQSGSAS